MVVLAMGEVVIFNLSERVVDGIRIAYKYWDEGFWALGAWVYGTLNSHLAVTHLQIIIPRVAMYNYRFVESMQPLTLYSLAGTPRETDGELIINGKQLMFLDDLSSGNSYSINKRTVVGFGNQLNLFHL